MKDGAWWFLENERAAEIRLNESGSILLASRSPVTYPIGPDDPRVLEVLIIGHTDLVVRLTALLSERFGFAGAWRFGLLITGLRGAISYELSEEPTYETGPQYTKDEYPRAVTASVLELVQSPERVVNRLVSSLLRSLDSHGCWAWLLQKPAAQ